MLDIEDPRQLEDWLRATGHIAPDEPIEARVLAGGVSNRTVLVERAGGERWVLKQALEKLRVPVDWFCAPERIEREALGMQVLHDVAPAGTITRLIFCDPDVHVLAMEAVPEPHDNWKSLLLAGVIEVDHFRQFGQLLATLRSAPHDPVFDDRSYYEVLRLEPYYAYTAQQVPRAAPFLTALIERTRRTAVSLVHGDYSPKNVLIREGRLVLLDHEVIHWGDPDFDIGFAMAHFLSKARHMPQHRERLMEGIDAFLGELPNHGETASDHTIACLLARVAGRSQLEYLTPEEKSAQLSETLAMLP